MNSFYIQNKQRLLNLFLSNAKPVISLVGDKCVALCIYEKEFSIVYSSHAGNKVKIELAESYPYNDLYDLYIMLSQLVKSHNLKNIYCLWILQPEDYQLLITDALPVLPSEFQSAIRFKVKDLLRFPINDVVIDSFQLPIIKVGSPIKIMLVVAQSSKLLNISDQIIRAGLNLKVIDIPELALRNIASLYEKEGQSIALIYAQEKNIQLLITFQKEIYVSRNLMFSLGLTEINDQAILGQRIEHLTTEIQRSFGYYQSQWRQPIPARILFTSSRKVKEEVILLLSQQLRLTVEMINLNKVGIETNLTNAQQGKYLPIIGGLLRAMD